VVFTVASHRRSDLRFPIWRRCSGTQHLLRLWLHGWWSAPTLVDAA